MRRKPCIILAITFLGTYGFAQNEANIWYFGSNAGLDFNSGEPMPLLDSALDTQEGCATISDNSGALLFYTDGITVWNKNHVIMANGYGLNGDSSSAHSAIIVPKPNTPDIYYIFTVDVLQSDDILNPALNKGLQYSEVDMTLDSGLGGITVNKNMLLHSPTTEKLTAIKRSNSEEFWVVSHKWNSNEFIAYNISSFGIDTTPVISAVGTIVDDTPAFIGAAVPPGRAIGQIKISPDGKKLAVARAVGLSELQLFDFDANTGIVSNPITLLDFNPDTEEVYGVEFSPNSTILYVSVIGNGVYQYNLKAGSSSQIINSQVLLTTLPRPYCAMQLATNGKIYIAKVSQQVIDVIHKPNIIGLGCDYGFEYLSLNGRFSRLGLPPFIQSFFQVGFQFENVCEGQFTQFNSNISQAYDTLLWDFGDGTSETNENPIHIYATAGDYDVILSVTAGTQSSVETKRITVYEKPVVANTIELKQCDDDLDGFSRFNLTEVLSELSTNHAVETITFHESFMDSEYDQNPIANLVNYTNQTVSTDVVWVRVENASGCFETAQIYLIVSTTQIPSSFIKTFYSCDDGTDTQDGIATFDLSAVNAEITSLFPVGQQLDINYYRNQTDALTETNPILNTSNYQNISYPNTQNIYIRVDSALNNDCLGLGHHLTLLVETVPIANPVTIAQQCDADGDGMFAFDTSTIQEELINGQTNVSVSYTKQDGTVLPNPLPNPFLTTSQIIVATVSNTLSQDTDGDCAASTNISFMVEPAAVANPVQDLVACDDNADGFFEFDTSQIETTLLNSQSGMQVTYTAANGTLLPSPLPNPFTSQTQAITAKVQSTTNSFCYDETIINFVVNTSPIANTVADDFVCDDPSNDGWALFTLSNYNAQILNGQSDVIFEVLYFESLAHAESTISPLPDDYGIVSASEIIFARIQNKANPDCYDITSFKLGVFYMPNAYSPDDLQICDDDSNDGSEVFDLGDQKSAILNGQSSSEHKVSFHFSLQDAEENLDPFNLMYSAANGQTIYARVENSTNPNCFSTTEFKVYVREKPVLTLSGSQAICEGNSVELIADVGYDSYLWSTGATTRMITVDAVGDYNVTATNSYGDLDCATSKTITVTKSNVARIIKVETEDWSENNNKVTVVVEGDGDYEYSLDGISYQDSNQFDNLTINDYAVYVRDKKGCGTVTEAIYLLFYPKYFTPNNDGFHDTWQLYNSNKEPANTIHIYDRYGKLLKQISPMTSGWDGTFNGKPLPTDDYWFVLQRENGKSYTGHFSLKR